MLIKRHEILYEKLQWVLSKGFGSTRKATTKCRWFSVLMLFLWRRNFIFSVLHLRALDVEFSLIIAKKSFGCLQHVNCKRMQGTMGTMLYMKENSFHNFSLLVWERISKGYLVMQLYWKREFYYSGIEGSSGWSDFTRRKRCLNSGSGRLSVSEKDLLACRRPMLLPFEARPLPRRSMASRLQSPTQIQLAKTSNQSPLQSQNLSMFGFRSWFLRGWTQARFQQSQLPKLRDRFSGRTRRNLRSRRATFQFAFWIRYLWM